MRVARVVALTALLSAPPALARAQDCGPLKILDIVHMIPSLTGNADFIPVMVDGKPHDFLLDTGGYYSQIGLPLAEELNLSSHASPHVLYDAAGNASRREVVVPAMKVGEITDTDTPLMISPTLHGTGAGGEEGALAMDAFGQYDAELDFASDTLNLFSPDHCPGHVVYWNAPAVAEVPIALVNAGGAPAAPGVRLPGGYQPGFHIMVPVTLDGQKLQAMLDTGAPETSLRMDRAEGLFHFTMGSPGTPFHGYLNGDTSLKSYSHLFQSLSFGGVSVDNAHVAIIPNAMGRFIDPTPLVGDRTKTERDLVNAPELILGMDVLRRLRVYLALHEGKMYVSPSTAAPEGSVVQPYSKDFLTAMLTRLDEEIAAAPDDAATLNDRCFWRAIARTALDGALADCDKSLKIEPGIAATLDSRAFVLYQQGDFHDALAAYDLALKTDARMAPSLLMRGLSKGKLGDAAGEQADIAAAKADDPDIQSEFHRIGIDP